MKVRCYDNSYLEDCLTVGRIYDVKEIKENYYVIKDDKGITNLFWHGEFEIVKENEMEKTFREVIADIKEGEVWEDKNFVLTLGYDERLRITHKEGFDNCVAIYIDINGKFKLKREEFTFTEAFKAYEEGKEIKSLYSDIKYYQDVSNEGLIEYLSIEEIRGKWYINN